MPHRLQCMPCCGHGKLSLLDQLVKYLNLLSFIGFQTFTIPKDELEVALEGASMENKTLIIAVANKAYTEEGSFLALLLQSFQVGEGTQLLRNHLLLAAIDQTAFEQCNLRKLHCYKLMTDSVDFSGEGKFMSSAYLEITWMKTLFQANVLGRGYNFIFTVSSKIEDLTLTFS